VAIFICGFIAHRNEDGVNGLIDESVAVHQQAGAGQRHLAATRGQNKLGSLISLQANCLSRGYFTTPKSGCVRLERFVESSSNCLIESTAWQK